MVHSTLFTSTVVALCFLIAPAGTSALEERSLVPHILEVQQVLRDLALTPCDRECTTDGCLASTDHRSKQGGTSHGGSYHGCLGTEMGCDYHGCGISLNPGYLERLVDLVASLPRSELLEMVELEPNLALNAERGALQVVGCDQTIVATMPFPPEALGSGQTAGSFP